MKHPKKVDKYRVILQDIVDPLIRVSWPPTPEKLVEAATGPLRDAAVDVYAFGLNHAAGCTHCSKIYPIIGDDQPFFKSSSALRANRATKMLCAEGHDPLKVLCDGAHRAGMDFFVRLRMNDLHDRVGDNLQIGKPTTEPKTRSPGPYFYTPKWKREHPEWLIGDPDASTDDLTKWTEAKAGNYAIGGFREFMYSFARESIVNYDIDGFELDFMRFPYFFPRYEAYSQRHIMTAFVRRIRECIDNNSNEHPIYLSARIPDTLECALLIGLDVQEWLKEQLLDMVVIGGGYQPFGTPWDNIVNAAKKANIPAFACFNWGPATGTKLHPSLSIKDLKERLYAIAYRAIRAGAQGFELFNFFYAMSYYYQPQNAHLGYDFTREISDLKFLETARKSYYLQHEHSSRVMKIYGHATWRRQVPLRIGLSYDGIGHISIFEVADDLARYPEASTRLWLQIVDLGPEDEVQFYWNSKPIEPNPQAFKGVVVFDNYEFEFDLQSEDIHQGDNALEIRLLERNKDLEPFITLVNAKLAIDPLSIDRSI